MDPRLENLRRATTTATAGVLGALVLLGCEDGRPDPRLTVRVEDTNGNRICIRPIDPARDRATGCYALDADDVPVRPGACATVILPARFGIEGPVNEPIRRVTLLAEEACLPAALIPE